MDDVISITEEDLSKEEYLRLKQKTDGTDVLVDIDRGLFISLGVPLLGESGTIIVPTKPHLFIADQLRVIDKDHPHGVFLNEVPVLIAHAIRSAGDEWVFTSGQSVAQTAEAWNQYARKNNLPYVEFIVACNPYQTDSNVRFLEFGALDRTTITYSIGENVHFGGFLERNGEVRATAELKKGYFQGLDTLLTSKQIKIL